MTDELIEGLVLSSRITRQGQSCTAGSRLYLHRDVHDEVLARLTERLGALRVGDPLDEASDIGAVINQTQFDSIRDYLEDGLANPAMRVELGGLPVPLLVPVPLLPLVPPLRLTASLPCRVRYWVTRQERPPTAQTHTTCWPMSLTLCTMWSIGRCWAPAMWPSAHSSSVRTSTRVHPWSISFFASSGVTCETSVSLTGSA